MLKKRLIKKYQNAPGVLTTSQAEARHANMARAYFNSTPTIGNLYNGVVNWLKSKSILLPEGTGLITGTAPTPVRATNAKEALEMVRKMKEAKRAAEAAKKAEQAARARARAEATRQRFSYEGKTQEQIAAMRERLSAAGKKGAASRQQNPVTSESYANRFVKARTDAVRRMQQQGMSASNREATQLTGKFTPIRTAKHTNSHAIRTEDLYE